MAKIKKILPNLIIVGSQGSGKSTQSDILVKNYHYKLIASGKIIRDIIKSNTQLGENIKKYVSRGDLIPNDILINKVFLPTLKKIKNKNGLVFDGIPRNLTQLKQLIKIFSRLKYPTPYLINIIITPTEAIKRISTRKICSLCATVVNPNHTGFDENLCPKCKGKLETREDDKDLKIITKRLELFQNHIIKIVKYFKSIRHYIEIDGKYSIEKVNDSIIEKIKKI